DQVRMRGIVAHDKGLLPEQVQQRPAALDIARSAGSDDEELAGLGCVRVTEHRCCDVAPSAARMRAGELRGSQGARGAGLPVAVSGYLLLFPFYLTDIFGMQIAQVVHSVIAVLFVALILGHIYIGTLGMEGAFEAMWTGEVDFNWAKEHHDLWLEDGLAKPRSARPPQLPSPTP